MNEWNGAPLHLANVLHLLPEVAPRWCNDNLPHKLYETVGSLVQALSFALSTSEAELMLNVKRLLLQCNPDVDALVDFWLQSQGTPMIRYLSVCSNVGSLVDGLFIWLASFAFTVHLNVIHGDGVWTTRQTAVPNFCDPAIVFVLGYYLAAPACQQLQVSPNKKSHISLIHQDPRVKYHFCNYQTTSRACMRHHVHIHTKGEQYTLCKKAFPSLKVLERHSVLHKQRQCFECEAYDAVFMTTSSLALHVCGKYGPGYVCNNCQTRFDTPAQRKQHHRKCSN